MPERSDTPGAAPTRRLDHDHIGAQVAELSAQDLNWHEWFSSHAIEPLRLEYEGFSDDPRSGLRHVLAALGRDVSRADAISLPTARLADDESSRWAARFRAEHGLE